jgi:hypothetical protein
MTEQEWLVTPRFYDLTHHKSSRNERKRRLLLCACTRRILSFLSDQRFVDAVAGCEAFADSKLDWKGMLALRKAIRKARSDLEKAGALEAQNHAASAVEALTAKEFMSYKMACEAARHAVGAHARPAFSEACDKEQAQQLRLAHDIFGNPFRPAAFDPAWRSDTALSLAKHIYESRDFAQVPILADALQDAGCDNTDILSHCRDPQQTHVRGCWVVDMILCKL